ncbi:MAG TPA: hypothetical protein DHV42_02125 [Lachnospiraceae bacterium]|jgi:hypothetical protein|nr:hypothetical protein [Lachnospiraceae bacterium]
MPSDGYISLRSPCPVKCISVRLKKLRCRVLEYVFGEWQKQIGSFCRGSDSCVIAWARERGKGKQKDRFIFSEPYEKQGKK